MNLNDLLANNGIDPRLVIVMRHRPYEPRFNRVLPWLAAEKPEIFNAYQQTQGIKLESAMKALQGSGYVTSCIAYGPGKALFIGLYRIGQAKPLTRSEYWQIPEFVELKALGMQGFKDTDARGSILWFDMPLTDIHLDWKGKLVVGWPPPERSWWRRSHKNVMPVLAVREESALESDMPEWNSLDLSWDELAVLPARWRAALSQWRGMYLIFDESDGKSYVGAAYGNQNLFGRWLNYAATGHGGNRMLRKRDPKNFRFTILQRVSPDMPAEDVIRLEGSWKDRLHTRVPHGLNEN